MLFKADAPMMSKIPFWPTTPLYATNRPTPPVSTPSAWATSAHAICRLGWHSNTQHNAKPRGGRWAPTRNPLPYHRCLPDARVPAFS